MRRIGWARIMGAVALVLLGWTGSLQAQELPKFDGLDELLKAVESERLREQESEAARFERFVESRDEQAELLATLQAEVDAIRAESSRLEGRLDELDTSLAQERAAFDVALGDYASLFDAFHGQVGKARQENSLYRTSRPARDAELGFLVQPSRVPATGDIRALWRFEFDAMTWEATYGSYRAQVILTTDQLADRQVFHAGPFLALAAGHFLTIDDQTGVLQELRRDPPWGLRKTVARMQTPPSSGLFPVIVDPSGNGAVLDLFLKLPTIAERVAQGRFVGVLIILLLIAGALLGAERLIRFAIVGRNIRLERKEGVEAPNNPMRRIVKVYEDDPAASAEVLEKRLEEAVSRELPALERRTGVLKVMAAMATLLGLLGTVIGMIRTFEALALFGGGEPRLMASGISEALVTTMLGLMAAIPLLIIHGLVASRSQFLIAMIEHEAIGLVARRSERRAQLARDKA